MAHFYANIQGNRGEATRMGTKNSGIVGHIRGWDIGVKLRCYYSKEKDTDVVVITLTSGKNGVRSGEVLGHFTVDDLE